MKYRAYHKVDKRYYDLIGINLEYGDCILRMTGMPVVVPRKVLTLEFFTGFQLNGKDIFEGDILSDSVEDEKEGIIISNVQVFWDKKQGSWVVDCSFSQNKSFTQLLSEFLSESDNIEIFGTIHDKK